MANRGVKYSSKPSTIGLLNKLDHSITSIIDIKILMQNEIKINPRMYFNLLLAAKYFFFNAIIPKKKKTAEIDSIIIIIVI